MAKSVYEQSGYRYRRYQKPSSARKKKLAVAAVVLAALLAAFLCMAAGAAGILRTVSIRRIKNFSDKIACPFCPEFEKKRLG